MKQFVRSILRLYKEHPVQTDFVSKLLVHGKLVSVDHRKQTALFFLASRFIVKGTTRDDFEVWVRGRDYYTLRLTKKGFGSLVGHYYLPDVSTQENLRKRVQPFLDAPELFDVTKIMSSCVAPSDSKDR